MRTACMTKDPIRAVGARYDPDGWFETCSRTSPHSRDATRSRPYSRYLWQSLKGFIVCLEAVIGAFLEIAQSKYTLAVSQPLPFSLFLH